MSYTTINQVAGMFPTFKRGAPQQNPPDALIQTYIDDVAAEIDAVLERRFSEAVAGAPYNGAFAAWVAALPADALNVLERINRYGAAAQLGQTLAAFGVATARELAEDCFTHYNDLLGELNARDRSGRPMASGLYDHLFDSLARTETPRPGLQGVAGGDQPPGETPAGTGASQVFGKFDRRGT
ncbi:MAG TPA: hypothetical protein VGZ29_13720 [Terriglobia bacterium]|nr:hypothetical protein [Terriglobia bacterium]